MMKTMAILATATTIILTLTLPAVALSLNLFTPTMTNAYQPGASQTDLENNIAKGFTPPPKEDVMETAFAGDHLAVTPPLKQDLYYAISLSDNEFPVGRKSEVETSGTIPVPEPASLVLLGGGLIGLSCLSRRRKRSNKDLKHSRRIESTVYTPQ